jgi:peptidoglycan/LPS O-acetylase OafA/YrhL
VATPLHYRPDIDGLRALSVAAVIAYHFGRFGCAGGYAGVDVFFVISGYLMAQLVGRDLRAGSFDTASFYERRVRRLGPALAVVAAASCVAGWFILLPRHLASFGASLASAAGLSANLYFWADSDYFSDDAALKPLLHLWSLGVEEQFYLVLPPLLARLVPRGSQRTRQVLVALAAVSFALDSLVARVDHGAAFYAMPLRMWELLLGCLLADLPLLTLAARPALRNTVAALGLALIGLAALRFDEATSFPALAALAPSLGASAVLAAGQAGGSWAGRLVGAPPLVALGRASYSLYLWHWPLVVFTRHALVGELRPRITDRLLLATLLLGAVSYWFVERPLRRPGSRTRFLAGALLAWLALAGFGVAAWTTGGFPARALNPIQRMERARRPTVGEYMRATCAGDAPLYGRVRRDLCRLGADAGSPSYLVWGDSHAHVLAPRVELLAARDGRTGLVRVGAACAPWISVTSGPCAAGSVREALADPGVRNVILHARWGDSADRAGRSQHVDLALLRRELAATLSAAARPGRRVALLGVVPEARGHVPDAIARSLWLGGELDVSPLRAEHERRAGPLEDSLRELAAAHGAVLLSPTPLLCGGPRCDVVRGEHVLYVDAHHLSEAGARLLDPLLEAALAPREP